MERQRGYEPAFAPCPAGLSRHGSIRPHPPAKVLAGLIVLLQVLLPEHRHGRRPPPASVAARRPHHQRPGVTPRSAARPAEERGCERPCPRSLPAPGTLPALLTREGSGTASRRAPPLPLPERREKKAAPRAPAPSQPPDRRIPQWLRCPVNRDVPPGLRRESPLAGHPRNLTPGEAGIPSAPRDRA